MRSESVHPFGELYYRHSEPPDYEAIGGSVFRRMLFDMYLVRAFETEVLERHEKGMISGPIHASLGQEGIPAAVLRHLRPGDYVFGTHRSHHHFIVQTLARMVDESWNPLFEPCPPAAVEMLARTFGEVVGLTAGLNVGVGGSMHLRNEAAGFVGSSAIVGGGIPIAAGLALSQSLRSSSGCAVCFVGDGAVNQGTFHESANLAGIFNLPLLIVVENNGYAEATTPGEASAVNPLATQGLAHGLAAYCTKGDDVPAVYFTAEECIKRARDGRGPSIMEVETYRHCDHVGGAPGSVAGYRSAAEEGNWQARDPISSLPPMLEELGLLQPGEIQEINATAVATLQHAVSLMPDTTSSDDRFDFRTLLRDTSEPTNGYVRPTRVDSPHTGGMRSYRQVIAETLARSLRQSEQVVFLGEEVGKPGGLLAQAKCLDENLLGSRILDMPISEASFVGMACGLALSRFRPIVELMYGSFALIAADQLFNHIGVMRALYGNSAEAPVVLRAKVPLGGGYGPQHSFNPAGLFRLFPGWRIVAPADPSDYAGTFHTAMRSHDPVLFVEFASLYDKLFEFDEEEFSTPLPLSGARYIRRGSDITVMTYGLGVHWVEDAVTARDPSGYSAEIIDLRALDAMSMDWETLEESLDRTECGLFIEPAAASQGIGPLVVAELLRRGYRSVASIACADVHPVAPGLERLAILDRTQIAEAVKKMVDAKEHDLSVSSATPKLPMRERN